MSRQHLAEAQGYLCGAGGRSWGWFSLIRSFRALCITLSTRNLVLWGTEGIINCPWILWHKGSTFLHFLPVFLNFFLSPLLVLDFSSSFIIYFNHWSQQLFLEYKFSKIFYDYCIIPCDTGHGFKKHRGRGQGLPPKSLLWRTVLWTAAAVLSFVPQPWTTDFCWVEMGVSTQPLLDPLWQGAVAWRSLPLSSQML